MSEGRDVTRLCSIADCERIHYGRGWCHLHWDRWRKHGDPMFVGKRGGDGRRSRLGYRQPMDEWEQRQVAKLLAQGLSYRRIQESTGICHMTVYRFVKKLRQAA